MTLSWGRHGAFHCANERQKASDFAKANLDNHVVLRAALIGAMSKHERIWLDAYNAALAGLLAGASTRDDWSEETIAGLAEKSADLALKTYKARWE